MTGFHHIAMNASDFDKTVAFYSEGLGFHKKISWGEPGKRAIMLDMGDGSCIEIFEVSKEASTETAPATGLSWLHLAIKTPDARAMFAQALLAGATVSKEPADVTIESEPQPTPVTIAFVFGPDGEEIEFFEER